MMPVRTGGRGQGVSPRCRSATPRPGDVRGHLTVSLESSCVVTDLDSGFRQHVERHAKQGFDLVEWHLSDVSEVCDGLKSVNDEQVVIAHFERGARLAG